MSRVSHPSGPVKGPHRNDNCILDGQHMEGNVHAHADEALCLAVFAARKPFAAPCKFCKVTAAAVIRALRPCFKLSVGDLIYPISTEGSRTLSERSRRAPVEREKIPTRTRRSSVRKHMLRQTSRGGREHVISTGSPHI